MDKKPPSKKAHKKAAKKKKKIPAYLKGYGYPVSRKRGLANYYLKQKWMPIRVGFEYTKTFLKLSHNMREYIRDNVIAPTEDELEHLLKVKRIPGSLKMHKDICYDTIWKHKYYKNTDLMIMVRIKNSPSNHNLAAVIPCNVDHGTFRPISALLTLNLHWLLKKGRQSYDTNFNDRIQRVVLFEIVHSMNFA